MAIARAAAFLLATVSLLPAQTPQNQTLSTSGHFVVHGSTSRERLAIARRAEALRSGWNAATGLPGEQKTPVIIHLTPPSNRRVTVPRTALFLGDGDSIKIQVDCPEGKASGAEFEIAILRGLALEAVYRSVRPKEGRSYTVPPAWLVEGAWQEITGRESGLSSALFERLVQSSPPPKLETFVRQRPEVMDPTSRAIYRAHAMGLLRALLASENGRQNFADYIDGLHATRQDDPAAILGAFPALAADPSQLVKLWTLALARASASDRVEILSGGQTSERLKEILAGLREGVGDPETPDAVAVPLLTRDEPGRYRLRKAVDDLIRLEGRAHPLFRPVVEEYRAIISDLAVRRRRGAEKRLAAVGDLAAALVTRVDAISDYLNWLEATQIDLPSEAFSDALGDAPSQAVPKRGDAYSFVLDAAEIAAER